MSGGGAGEGGAGDGGGRRPLASRDTGWARWLTRRLAATAVTPNRISQASVLAAALAGGAFWLSGLAEGAGARAALLLAGALFCQLRLLCNLLDGMVAVEAGKGGPDGAFWNEVPDRVADVAILVGAGLGAGDAALGWAAASFALLTAYVRAFGGAMGMPADYRGPMAKPHRMAAITLAAAVATLEPLWGGGGAVMTAALWIVAGGAALTALRRAARLARLMRAGR